MSTDNPASPARRRWLLGATAASASTIAAVGAAEGLARVAGVRPWYPGPDDTVVEPGGRLYTPHATLGYAMLPGAFTVRYADGFTFRITHGPDGLRLTRPLGSSGHGAAGAAWIFGCSFTHGWALDDGYTYPWLLQRQFPGADVVNFGVDGYGTLQSLIQFREALRRGRPRVAVLAYARFHDARNTFLRSRRKEVAPYNRLGPLAQPRARLAPDGRLQVAMAEVAYREFPLMRRSALAHLAELAWNRAEALAVHSAAVTRAIIAEMAQEARANGVHFAVAFIHEKPFMQDFLGGLGVTAIDMAVDLAVPGNTSAPHDLHPSAQANREYAARLAPFLRDRLGPGAAAP